MSIKNKLSTNLKNLRLSKNLTQEDLGKALGTTKQAISDYERGRKLPDLHSIIKISTYFKCSIDSLIFTGTDINIDELSSISSVNILNSFEDLNNISTENERLIKDLDNIVLNLKKVNSKQKEVITKININE